MGKKIGNTVRASFVFADMCSVFCAFAGSMYILSPDEDPNANFSLTPSNTIIATLAAIVFGFTTNYFQGKRITQYFDGETDEEDEADYEGERTWLGNTLEIAYLLKLLALLIIWNLFAVSAIKSYIHTLSDPEDPRSLMPLEHWLMGVIALATLLIDFPFSLVTDAYESCEEFQANCSGQHPRPLVAALIRPLRTPAGRAWIRYVSVTSHVGSHTLDVVVSTPAESIMIFYNNATTAEFWAAATPTLTTLLMLTLFNWILTCLFDLREANTHLQKSHPNTSHDLHRPLLSSAHPETDSPLMLPPDHSVNGQPTKEDETIALPYYQYWFCRMGIKFTQAPQHAISVAMPVFVLMRHIVFQNGLTPNTARLLVGLPSVCVFLGALVGIQCSEVHIALQRLKKLPSNKTAQKNCLPCLEHCCGLFKPSKEKEKQNTTPNPIFQYDVSGTQT